MKSLYLVLLVSLCQGLLLETTAVELAAPRLLKVTVLDPLAISMSWTKIESGDAQDPIVGYKAKVWVVDNIVSSKYAYVDGKLKEVIENKEQPIGVTSIPDGTPVEIVTSAEETEATYHDVKVDVTYEVRVLAYTKHTEGPLSDPIRVKLNSN